MITLGLAELADRIRLEPGGWSVLAVDEARIHPTAQALGEELTFLLDDEGAGAVWVFGEDLSGPALVDRLARCAAEDIALLPLRTDLIEPATRALDYGRGRLMSGPRGVIVTSEPGVRLLAAVAPSFWSWIGPRVWHIDPAAGQLDREARLASLREGTGLSDAEVLQRAKDGTLAPDPVFAEWLVLLGRGDLLGH